MNISLDELLPGTALQVLVEEIKAFGDLQISNSELKSGGQSECPAPPSENGNYGYSFMT